MNEQNIIRDKTMQKILRQAGCEELIEELTGQRIPSKAEEILEQFITCDKDLIRLKQEVLILSKEQNSHINVLIQGETGTGKELIARALHGNRTGQFVAVNTAGIPDTLLESEFFGCVTGAFTGAINRLGYLREAKAGTLFLDEIGDMPLLLQCKLLRVLENRVARALGSDKEYPVDCRFVAATNKIHLEVTNGNDFRADLYFRVAKKVLRIKPLRERREDINLICAAKKYEIMKMPCDRYSSYSWPGNIRELLNFIETEKCLEGI